MAPTPVFGWPLPDSDAQPDVPLDMQLLAEAIEDTLDHVALATYHTRVGWTSGTTSAAAYTLYVNFPPEYFTSDTPHVTVTPDNGATATTAANLGAAVAGVTIAGCYVTLFNTSGTNFNPSGRGVFVVATGTGN